MDGLEIDGGKPLHGDIIISGAKNAALPLLCLGLITDAPLILENVPELADTISMEGLLCHLGADVTREGEIVTMRGGARQYDAPMILFEKCGHRFWFLGHCWRVMARHAYPCLGAGRLAHGQLIFMFVQCRGLARWLSLPMAIFRRAHQVA